MAASTSNPNLTASDKATAFRALHQRAGAFIIPNPWDVGSACILAQLGFEALATTSAGFAFSVGKLDNTIGRDRMLAHVGDIVAATSLPVSADLENGFADDADGVATTIRLAGATGLAGGSIEDATGRADAPIYEFGHAVDRIRAAVEAARALPHPFVLTARAENHLVGRPDLKDTIKRLQAYQEAGADVLYAPGLVSEQDIVAWCRENMAVYKAPRIIQFVETLPKSGSGKVMWRALQEAEAPAPVLAR